MEVPGGFRGTERCRRMLRRHVVHYVESESIISDGGDVVV